MPSSPEFEEKKDDELRPLDPALRARAEAALGEDLGRVRLGRGPAAHAQAAELGARAFTIGADVYFARGEGAPGTEEGERLLLHELAHVVQQRGTGAASADRAALEAEADAAATPARGGRATVRLKAPGGRAQKQEKGKTAPPTIARHGAEITAVPPQGTITGGGFSIPYAFDVVRGSTSIPLVLHVPEGVAVTVTPLTDLGESDYRVQNAAGSGVRAVVITVSTARKAVPKLQVSFSRPSTSYIVVFQFPISAGK